MNRTSDYSFVLNTIDNEMNEALTSSSSASNVVGAKRKADEDIIVAIASSKRHDTSSSIKLKHEVEELKLQKQQLEGELQTYQREHRLFKEDAMKQLKTLQENNQQLKKQLEQSVQKYDESKKKWQEKYRELESQKASSKSTASQPAATSTSNSTQQVELLKLKILSLEEQLSDFAIKYHALNKQKIDFEHKALVMEKEVQNLRPSVIDEDAGMYRKLYCDLEYSSRKKAKDLEKLESRLKNQTLLEEELSSAKQKVNLLEERLASYQQMETQYQTLSSEYKQWMGMIEKLSPEKRMSPSSMVHYVQELQTNYALQEQQQKEIEILLTSLRKELLAKHEEISSLTQDKASLSEKCDRLERKHDLLRGLGNKQYEQEVGSLRQMLKTFDLEFSIGKVDTDKMLEHKDELIEMLRSDLDSLRKEFASVGEKVVEQAEEIERVRTQPQESERESLEIETMKGELEEVKSDFQALQEITGMDFLPHKTQILRLSSNPLDLTRSRPPTSSLPRERLLSLQREVLSLQQNKHPDSSFNTTHSNNSSGLLGGEERGGAESKGGAGARGEKGGVDAMKLNQRLKELFKEKIAIFRQAVYLLTGFKMELLPTEEESVPRLRLKSMFAERAEDCLLFQIRDETPELLESDFVNTLDPSHIQYLQSKQSVPAFLANLTLELFEAQTFMG